MDKANSLISVPAAILIGSVVIAVAILVSGGVIKLKNQNTTTPATTTTSAATPEDKLSVIASGLKMDVNKFKSCLTSDKYKEELDKDMADADSAGISGTPGFIIGKSTSDGKIRGIKIAGAYPYEVFKAVFDELTKNTSLEQIPQLVVNQAFAQESEASKEDLKKEFTIAEASVDDDPIEGDSKAGVTLIEFSDYECPFCKRHFSQTLPSLRKDYIDSGKVKLVFRDFIAVPSHNPWATTEAIASNCAREQGGDDAYFKFHDEVYSKTKANGEGLP